MENSTNKIKYLIYCKNENEFLELLRSGFDPNLGGGWPIRLAARYGCSTIVESLIQFGANPHLLSESGASTLQLAVFSGEHWDTDKWKFLLSCCDSSQLADGAAVAIIFNNDLALTKILATGRCNMNIPTTLTGKTLEVLAKGYKMNHLLSSPTIQSYHDASPLPSQIDVSSISPRITRQNRQTRTGDNNSLAPHNIHQRNLSPSVARFFHQTAGQTSLSPARRAIVSTSSRSAEN